MPSLRAAAAGLVSLGLLLVSAAHEPPAATAATVAAPTVAVLDSGIDASHEQFEPGQVVGWIDLVNGRDEMYDDLGHGTAVASRVGGRTLGAHAGTRLLVAKVLDANNSTGWATVTKAIDWAVAEGADVINVSLWSSLPAPNPTSIDESITKATEAGVLVVWIAGNGGAVPSSLLRGANTAESLVVGAAEADGRRASFSQSEPELLATGSGVPIAHAGGGTGLGWGTSFAAPWVAGAAARLLEAGAPRDPAWLSWVLLHSATDQPYQQYIDEGYGFLGQTELDDAEAVARGEAPYPARDGRDDIHDLTESIRMLRSGRVPTA